MRTPGLENRSITQHLIRRLMRKPVHRTYGVPQGGSLWQRVLGVISPLDAADSVFAPEMEVARLFWTSVLRNAADGFGDGIGSLWIPQRSDLYSFSGTQNDVDLGGGIVHRVSATAARASAALAHGRRGPRSGSFLSSHRRQSVRNRSACPSEPFWNGDVSPKTSTRPSP